MLEFNNEHKSADLSSIKTKIENAKLQMKKIIVGGVLVSAMVLLSGCSLVNHYDYQAILPGSQCAVSVNKIENTISKVTFELEEDSITVDIKDAFILADASSEVIDGIFAEKTEENIIINQNKDGKLANSYALIEYEGNRFIVEVKDAQNSVYNVKFFLEDGTVIMIHFDNMVYLQRPTEESLNMLKQIALSGEDISTVLKDNEVSFGTDGDLSTSVKDSSHGLKWVQLTLEDGSVISIPTGRVLEYEEGKTL